MTIAFNKKTLWFSADLHFGHKRVADHRSAWVPDLSFDNMDEMIIARWNAQVAKSDVVFILGDVALTSAAKAIANLSALNGKKYLIAGNHDKKLLKNPEFCALFESIDQMLEIDVLDDKHPTGKQRITLCHYPMLTWNRAHYGAWQLHGHSHGNLTPMPGKRFDVGLDPNFLTPVHYNEVKLAMACKEFVQVDHHD